MSQTKLQPTTPSSPKTPTARKCDNQKPSCVLLVCVYDTIVFQITNSLVFQRFQQFGHIMRILIFQRKQVTKLFVEFQMTQQACKAKQALDGKKLCNNICKMSIYYSNFENVDLRHQTSQGMEFFNEKNENYDKNSSKTLSNKSPTKNLDDFDQFSMFGFNGHLGNSKFGGSMQNEFLPRSKTDINEIQWHINQIKKQKQQNNWNGLLFIDQTIKSDIDSILNCEIEQPQQKWSSSQTDGSPKRTLTPKIKNQQYKNQSITVVGFMVKTNNYKHSHVYNLFSNFGNISMIAIKKNQIRIKFRTLEFAAIAKNYLHNTWFFSNKIQMMTYPSSSIFPEQGQYCQLISYDESSDRFTQKKSITINPPSKTLHVSGMKREKCTLNEIMNMFRPYVQPVKVKILKQNQDKNMALVEFACLEDSFDVVADCHNMLVGGRKIQISFTKSQI